MVVSRKTRLGPVRAVAERYGASTNADDAGYDLHAGVAIPPGDRTRLERLCRCVFRPPLGQHRLQRLVDGRVAVALQHEWADGTTLVPRPRVNLLLYHDVLAPNAAWRRAIAPTVGCVGCDHIRTA